MSNFYLSLGKAGITETRISIKCIKTDQRCKWVKAPRILKIRDVRFVLTNKSTRLGINYKANDLNMKYFHL